MKYVGENRLTQILTKIKQYVDGAFKPKQTAVPDPSASGTGVTFISGISQDANGVITPSKKTVAEMTGATSVTDGAAGLVPKPDAGEQDYFLCANGEWKAVQGGGSSASAGTIKVEGTIDADEDWTKVGDNWVAYLVDSRITSDMIVTHSWLVNRNFVMLGNTQYTIDTSNNNTRIAIITTVKPVDDWNIILSLGVDGAQTLADVTQAKSDIAKLGTEKLRAIRYDSGKIQQSYDGTSYTDVMAVDATPTDGSTNPVQSNGVYDELANKAPLYSNVTASNKTVAQDLSALNSQIADVGTPITRTGATNTEGAISAGTFFRLDGNLCFAKLDIAQGETFTLGTKYDLVDGGGLNKAKEISFTFTLSPNFTNLRVESQSNKIINNIFFVYIEIICIDSQVTVGEKTIGTINMPPSAIASGYLIKNSNSALVGGVIIGPNRNVYISPSQALEVNSKYQVIAFGYKI